VQGLLINSNDSLDTAWHFISQAEVGLPVLMDTDGAVYLSWSAADNLGVASSPYPVQAVIDREGVIVYLSRTHDPGAVRAAIDGAL